VCPEYWDIKWAAVETKASNIVCDKEFAHKQHSRVKQQERQLTMTKAPESRMICLMLVPPVPMMAPTAALGTLIWHSSADWTEETRP